MFAGLQLGVVECNVLLMQRSGNVNLHRRAPRQFCGRLRETGPVQLHETKSRGGLPEGGGTSTVDLTPPFCKAVGASRQSMTQQRRVEVWRKERRPSGLEVEYLCCCRRAG